MSRYGLHACSFSGPLGDLPKRLHGDDEAVLASLSRDGRFSDFDPTPKLGATLERLRKAGRIRFEDEAYPWVRVTVLPGEGGP